MKLNSALSTLLVLLDSKRAESQSMSLRKRQEKQENLGTVRFNKPQTNAVTWMTSSQLVNAVTTKSTNLENVSIRSNGRLLSTASWEQVASFRELEASNSGGYRVSMSGDGSFLASAPFLNRNNDNTYYGLVRFFQKHKSDGTWEEMTDLWLTGVADGDYFGSNVSLSGNGQRVAIGAKSNDHEARKNSGSVSVYEMNGDGTSWLLMQVIHGESKNDYSGQSVALSKDGSTLAIGADLNSGNGENSGHVRVYQWEADTSSFNQLGEDIDGKARGDQSGWSVALSKDGSVVAIGAPYAGGSAQSGQVRVFYWDPDEDDARNSKWVQRGSSIVGETAHDCLGFSVDISGDGKILALGADEGDYAKVFQWKDGNEDEDQWEQIGKTLKGSDYFGTSISLSTPPSSDATILAVGSQKSAFTYTLVDNDWEEMADGVFLGAQVSLSSDGKTLAVGDPVDYGDDDEGSVSVYNLLVEKTSSPTSSPISETSIEPTSSPTSGSTLAPSPSGSNGDPHFRTWKGGHFEYHGQCDMILLKDQDFAGGLGLEVQIRTKLVRFWSFIQNAAIRIGQDTLEMQGSPDPFVKRGNNHYWINSIYQGQLTSLGGFPVKATYEGKHKNKRWFFSKYGGGNKISRSFEIDLSSKYPGQKIVIGSYKEFVRVDFHNAQSDAFGDSVGMLGDFATGNSLARDGVTELKDYTMLGHEWQVLPDDGMLFHNVSHPQFPEKCIEPEARGAMKRRRRLGESSITDKQAEAACAPIEDALDRKDCVYDVLVTQDITMVGAY